MADTWDDLRFLLALSRYGTIRGASAALGVNHATVSRRLARLQSRLGSVLFQQTPEGYRMTPDGTRLCATAETFEAELRHAEQRVEGRDIAVTGEVRLATTDLLFNLSRAAFRDIGAAHPGLRITLSLGARLSGIELGDVDIVLRFSNRPPPELAGRRLGRLPARLYAGSDTQWARPGADLTRAPWIRWQSPWRQQGLETWPEAQFPGAPVAARVDAYEAMQGLVAAGAGLGLLCPLVCDDDPAFTPLGPPIDEAGLDVWLLMHPDLRHLRRIRAVADPLAARLKRALAATRG